jgi:transcriptional regulator with XRE-family HTH domain
MDSMPIGRQVSDARKQAGLTQAELADRCRLDIRTIQRVETGDVRPRLYTVRVLGEALSTKFNVDETGDRQNQDIFALRRAFRRRRTIRIVTACGAVFLMLTVAVLGYPSWILFGMPKRTWAPFFYLIMFAHIIGIALTWRCPLCKGLLGDVFNTRYCSKCGLSFYGDENKHE